MVSKMQCWNLRSNSTFGCELQFAQKDTHEAHSGHTTCQPVFLRARPTVFCGSSAQGQLKGEAKAIRVPFGKNDKIPPQAFSFHTEVRHVQVEAGVRIVGEAAWRSCQRLQESTYRTQLSA